LQPSPPNHSYPFIISPSSMTSMWNYGVEIATVVMVSFAHATSHRCAIELCACATEPASLHNGCSSKQTRGGASCDAVLLASFSRRCHTSELHAVADSASALRSACCKSIFRCFRCMLQVFYINAAKVGQDVAHVAMTIHVSSVYSKYFIYFRCML
jgi:hypothetical protein